MAFQIKIESTTVHLKRGYRLECWEQFNEGEMFELMTVLETNHEPTLHKTLKELLQFVE